MNIGATDLPQTSAESPNGNKLYAGHNQFSEHHACRRDGPAPAILEEVQSKKHSQYLLNDFLGIKSINLLATPELIDLWNDYLGLDT